MAREIWLISDTHFGHENIIRYCGRPFASAAEMDEAMVERWNAVVKPQDKIYHLGDVYFRAKVGATVLPRLNGHKRLILGNHDDGKDPLLNQHFQKIGICRKFPEFGLLLTHLPVHESQFASYLSPTKGTVKPGMALNVHGHIHEKNLADTRYKNISVEQTDYRPINIEEIRVIR